MKDKPENVDRYLASFPEEIRRQLSQIRTAIREGAPEAEEVISYGMPAFRQNGMLVYFAAFSNHLSFFPGASGIEAFREELQPYKCSKGTVQLPFDKPLPLDLIKKITAFRVAENLEKKKHKKK